MKLEDNKTIVEADLCNNSSVSLIVMTPFELYIQDMNGRQHTIVIPSSKPEVCMHVNFELISHHYFNFFCSNTPSPHLLLLLNLRLDAV